MNKTHAKKKTEKVSESKVNKEEKEEKKDTVYKKINQIIDEKVNQFYTDIKSKIKKLKS